MQHKRKFFSLTIESICSKKWVKSSNIENETENFLLSHWFRVFSSFYFYLFLIFVKKEKKLGQEWREFLIKKTWCVASLGWRLKLTLCTDFNCALWNFSAEKSFAYLEEKLRLLFCVTQKTLSGSIDIPKSLIARLSFEGFLVESPHFLTTKAYSLQFWVYYKICRKPHNFFKQWL